jgi:MFS family permease
VAVTGAGSVEAELRLTHQGYATFAFALPLVAAALLEAGLALGSDVWRRAQLVVAGQAALAAALAFVAWTSSPWGLTLGLAFAGAASGVACGASQALLLAANRGAEDRAMVRWSLASAVGDVVTPLATGAALAIGRSYRFAMGAVAFVVALQCAASARSLLRAALAEEPPVDAEHPSESVLVALRRALHLPRLWVWLLAAASCTLLDELVIALVVLRLERDGAMTGALATAAAVTFAAGSVAGGAAVERFSARWSARAVLIASASVCVLAIAALLAGHGVIASSAALFALGVACSPHHPLAMARAYRELPDRPGAVQAIGQLFVVVDVVAPVLLGAVADRLGLGVAIACLGLQPLVVATCAVFWPAFSPAD